MTPLQKKQWEARLKSLAYEMNEFKGEARYEQERHLKRMERINKYMTQVRDALQQLQKEMESHGVAFDVDREDRGQGK